MLHKIDVKQKVIQFSKFYKQSQEEISDILFMNYFNRIYSLHFKSSLLRVFYFGTDIGKRTFIKSYRSSDFITKMPKDNSSSIVLKEMRQKNKLSSKNNSRFPPSEIYLCAIGNGSVSSSRALYMFTDHERYLFNCGEGTQRLTAEHKMKISKLDHIFVTHKSWENVGGILGLSLTVQEIGVPKLTLHGSPDLSLLFELSDTFIFLNRLDVEIKSYENESFSDDCIKVHYIPIFKSTSHSPESISPESDTSIDSDCESTEKASKKLRLSEQKSDVTVAYACKGHRKLGQLLLDKCVEFGVPPGPLLGDLKNGKDVTLPCGKIVHSKDVVSPEQVCPLFLVVECPSEAFLDPFVNEEKFKKYQIDVGNPSEVADLVVHFTPPEILKSSKYQEWMNRFPESTCHLILNNDCATLNSAAVHRIQHKLNLLHPGMFSLLQEKEVEEKSVENASKNIFQAHTLDRYFLRPAKGLDKTFCLDIEPKDFIEEAMNIEGFNKCRMQLQNEIKVSNQQTNGEVFPGVTFLGTGSSVPSKVRNVSAILVNTSENRYMLLDCGEGTYGQLHRLYGKECSNILLNLFSIFISHMHADHHLGLIKIFDEREELFRSMGMESEPLQLVGPRRLHAWLNNYYRNIMGSNSPYRFASCSSLEHVQYFKSGEQELENCQDIIVSTVPVNHCPDAHGVIISSQSSKWKLVYSGDTTPCARLVSAGQDCSLLIHEATMEDELKGEAVLKRHSTTSEAIKIGEQMNSKYTILTHFSQRYAKIPLFNESFHNQIGCAFDNMKVRSDELHILPLLIPALKTLFAEEVEVLHTKGNKRRLKLELINSVK